MIPSWFNATAAAFWEHVFSFFIDGIYFCFFYLIRRIYVQSGTFKNVYGICSTINEHSQIYKITTYHWRFQPNLIPKERSYWKSSSKTLLFLSLIIISALSLFECIRYSSSISLRETKLIPIVNWSSSCIRFFETIYDTF